MYTTPTEKKYFPINKEGTTPITNPSAEFKPEDRLTVSYAVSKRFDSFC